MKALGWVLIGAGMMLLSACEFSGTFTSAQISPLKITKDKEGKLEATTFSPNDTFYVGTQVSNVPDGGVTLRFQLFVEGHDNPALEKYLQVASDDSVTFTVTPGPPPGITPGTYRSKSVSC